MLHSQSDSRSECDARLYLLTLPQFMETKSRRSRLWYQMEAKNFKPHEVQYLKYGGKYA